MKTSPSLHRLLIGTFAAVAMTSTFSQTWPERPITLVVGFSAGGGVDVVGRVMANILTTQLKTSVVVDNRTGFSGNLAAQQVKRATPDGYTLLMAPTSSYAMTVKLMGTTAAGYDLVPDFKPVATVAELPLVLLASRAAGINTVEQLIKLAKSAPTKLSYGSTGNGSTEHVVTESFKSKAGIEVLHVPYRGSSPAMVDLMSGQIQLMFTTPPTALSNVQGGRAVALGVASPKRLAVMPDVPTLAEQGLSFEAASIYAILAPKGTPEAVVVRLNQALAEGLKNPDTRHQLNLLGVEVITASPAESASRLAAEVDKWSKTIDAANIRRD